jgi:hypothetical protein
MQHLDTDRLAALADEAPTLEETAHLATCVACRREREAFVELLELARREGAAGLDPDAVAAAPPLSSWDAISTTLRAEGLIRPSRAASASATSTTAAAPAVTPAREPARKGGHGRVATVALTYWRRAAASIALLVGGAALGRATAPAVVAVGPAPAPTASVAPTTHVAAAERAGGSAAAEPTAQHAGRAFSDTLPVYGEPSAQLASHTDDAVGFRSVEEAMAVLTRAQRDYQRAGAWLADHDSTSVGNSPQTLKARLAALDEVLPKLGEALHEAPQDPVLNQYYLTASDVRESTVRQLGRALPVGVRLNSF